jgi:redox-sensitive bicupin YhaK (pirin superfamily)
MKIRRANTRGISKNSWIESRRTFSNNSYFSRKYMRWGSLKVINDDVQQPGNMVPNHQHKNFDILGYMVAGELEHRDSLGNVSRAVPGQIQHMWCGKSIWHTEASTGSVPARYLQIWIVPKNEYRDTEPYYEIINKDLAFGPLNIDLHQDFKIQCGILNEVKRLNIDNAAYLYVISGTVIGDGWQLTEGDGAELDSGALMAEFVSAHIILFEE